MINPYRPIPPAPPPPPMPAPGPLPAAVAPVAPQPWPQPVQAVWPRPQSPVGALGLNWDPLGELAATVVGTPLAALAGAGIGFLIAGPIGAARGAIIGAAVPGTVFAGYEFNLTNPWWGKQPTRSGVEFLAILMAFPAISAVGYGVGLAIAGATGAAWGTLIAAAAPLAAAWIGGIVTRWLNPPVYRPDPVPVPTPTARM